jgi:hypothetical protein
MKHVPVFFLALLLISFPLFAEEISTSTELNLQVSSIPELKLGITHHVTLPFLQGSSPLTEDNNISLALTAELSPVSVNGISELTWTPIAFFQLVSGARFGSGWNISLFGADLYGIGINREDGGGKEEHSGGAFDGLLWKIHGGAALQFDLAAVIPGEWHHIVARTYQEINYKGYTAASAYESWYFENDAGENVNGLNYYGNLFLGYQFPKEIFLGVLNTAGLLAEADLYLYDTPDRSQWGDERIRWTFSGLFNFTIRKNLSAALLVQWSLERNYTDPDWEDLYYRERHINSSDPYRLKFYRAACVMTLKL